MAPVACGASIFIARHVTVPAIHGALCVRMAVNAFERAVIGLRCMAVGTAVPASGRVVAAAADRKEVVMRVECRRPPCQGAVAEGAVCRKTCGGMVRVCGGKIRFAMAGDAFGGGASEASVGVARAAWHGFMDPPRGKIGLIVVERRQPGRCVCEMTFRAIVAESRRSVVDRQCCVIVFAMTGNALRWRARETQCRVAGEARRVAVFAAQRKCSSVVVELQRDQHRCPPCRRVAVRAGLSPGPVG